MYPSSGEKLLYLCDTGICHSVWVASGLLVGLKKQFQSNQQTMMGTWMPETFREEK